MVPRPVVRRGQGRRSPRVSDEVTVADPALDEWRTYDEFAAGIDTFRLPNTDLAGTALALTLDDGSSLSLDFGAGTVDWSGLGASGTDPYDAVAVRDDVVFVNLPLVSREREALTVVYSTTSHRATVIRSRIAAEAVEGTPQVAQEFWAATTDGGAPTGEQPGPSRDLIGKRNVYRYSPYHLYEHVYVSSQRYAWQCLEGVQRGHGDMDLSTVWKFADGLYLFCFREFRIAVASVWLHDLGYQLMTTGIFLGLNGEGAAEHSRAGGHIYPLGSVSYPDAQPV
ncbi:MAG: MoaF N-terminal domain-containing protein [Actinobacteria bacterium]|nr:MoaF N-terminal domain-containing protein [Actinomycetota bacterium]